jgi:uncharacterized protein (DUF2252 family)
VQERSHILETTRTNKMARSAHAYVRGNTVLFYEWLTSLTQGTLPEGPPVWICGDCHVGNLGPVGDTRERVRIQIRDMDQTVIGNPTHDLIRLALSLASAARGGDLPGVTTARMLEAVMDGYQAAFAHDFEEADDETVKPDAVKVVLKQASRRTWKHLARERIDDTKPTIPHGKKLWKVSTQERRAVEALFDDLSVKRLATMVRSRDDAAEVTLVDVAYWQKGCSSLGRLRYAALVSVDDGSSGRPELCLMDLKEATDPAAPAFPETIMPTDQAERVVEGSRHISPFLGERMRAVTLLDRPVFIRELLPQDLKVELVQPTASEAVKAATFLATVVGFAHARQMDSAVRQSWQKELAQQRSHALDAPSWLWTSVVDLLVRHEQGYLEHCRRYALNDLDGPTLIRT